MTVEILPKSKCKVIVCINNVPVHSIKYTLIKCVNLLLYNIK